MSKRGAAVGLVVVGAFAGPAVAYGGSGPSYGGGLLPGAAAPRHYNPTVGIALEQRGARLALRFDTTLLCGRDVYQVSGRRVVPMSGGHASAHASAALRLGRGRLSFGWRLSVEVGSRDARGLLTIRGNRRSRGRAESCTHRPKRRFRALIGAAPAGPAAQPAPGRAYFGLNDLRIADGLRGPVLLRVGRDGKKTAARWTATAPCTRGPRELLVNFTPATRVAPDGSFRRRERFSQRFTDALVRYSVFFGGGFTSDGAAGTLRLRARVYDRRGSRLITHCDSGVRRWTALRADLVASRPPGGPVAGLPAPGTPTPPQWINAASWSLNMTSDPGDYIGQGQTWSYTTGDGQNRGSAQQPTTLQFEVFPSAGGDWGGGFWPPRGQNFAVGTTYTAVKGSADGPALNIGGMGRGCGTTSGTFTVEALDVDPGGALRTAKVSFEQHCEGLAPALRGTWEFHAP
jgi:hypothetical protein